jgi:hypothetical protein
VAKVKIPVMKVHYYTSMQVYDGVRDWAGNQNAAQQWNQNAVNHGRVNNDYGDKAAQANAWYQRSGSE